MYRRLVCLALSVLFTVSCGALALKPPVASPTPIAPTRPVDLPSPTGLTPATQQPTLAPSATALVETATPTTATPPTEAPTEAPTEPPPTPTPGVVFMTFKDFEIVPAQITIPVGTTIVFQIEGGFLSFHQPYNFDAPNVFEAPAQLGNGATWSYTFKEAGTVTIRCGYHSEMVATIIVTP